jgi:two-component system sensor histidine kinase UhpB
MKKLVSVLLLEDSEEHAALICRCLAGEVEHNLSVKVTRTKRLQDAIDQLAKHSFDVVISDLSLPDSHSDDTLLSILNAAGDTPVVATTSFDDPELGMALVKQGAQDFLVKSEISGPLITRSVLYAIERRHRELQQEAHAADLARLVAERTRYLELLLAVSDVSHQAQSNREALQQTVDLICSTCEMPFGSAILLPEPQYSSAVDIGVEFQGTKAEAQNSALLNPPPHRERLLQQAIDGQHVVVDQSTETTAIVLPILLGQTVPAIMEFWTTSPPADMDSLVAVTERIRTEIGRVFERDEFQRMIEESTHMEQQSLIGDLHDGLGHQLSGLTWLAHSHVLKLEEVHSEFTDSATDLHSGLRKSLQMLRRSLRGLTPLQLAEGGLISALSALVAETSQRFPCHCDFDCDVSELPVSDFTAAQIYRIVQESLTNVGKHSKATSACVTLLRHRDRFTVSISDDGKGRAAAEEADAGLGFSIMRHRARLIGGDLIIRDASAGGLQILLEGPLQLDANSV